MTGVSSTTDTFWVEWSTGDKTNNLATINLSRKEVGHLDGELPILQPGHLRAVRSKLIIGDIEIAAGKVNPIKTYAGTD